MSGTRLVRSGKGGATIHLRDCSRVGVMFWPCVWAEGKPDREWAGMLWLKPCAYCLPELARMRSEAMRFDRPVLASGGKGNP